MIAAAGSPGEAELRCRADSQVNGKVTRGKEMTKTREIRFQELQVDKCSAQDKLNLLKVQPKHWTFEKKKKVLMGRKLCLLLRSDSKCVCVFPRHSLSADVAYPQCSLAT